MCVLDAGPRYHQVQKVLIIIIINPSIFLIPHPPPQTSTNTYQMTLKVKTMKSCMVGVRASKGTCVLDTGQVQKVLIIVIIINIQFVIHQPPTYIQQSDQR
jgi:hypothetical protein